MVHLLNIAAVLFAGFSTVQGCTWCQCLFPDGSHCCVQSSASGQTDCQAACAVAQQAGPNQFEPGRSCNAGGKYVCVGGWNAHFRDHCHGYA